MDRIKVMACAFGAVLGAGAWSESEAQLSPKMQEDILRSTPTEEQLKAQRIIDDRIYKQMNQQIQGGTALPQLDRSKLKLEPFSSRPLASPGPSGARPAPAPTAPSPSAVTYGETRPYSTGAAAKPEQNSGDAAPRKPAAPRAPERTPCVYKPVMTDEDKAACR